MDNGNTPDFDDLDELLGDIDEFNEILERGLSDEDNAFVEKACRDSKGYLDNPYENLESIDEFVDLIRERLDDLIIVDEAIPIVRELNRYAAMNSDKILALAKKHKVQDWQKKLPKNTQAIKI